MSTPEKQVPLRQRIYSVDLLRGIVMMIMLLDHTREFVHAGALQSDPTNLETTTTAVFFTRWITHFCAPIFVFLAGTSILLQKMNGKSNRELSWFLMTRGVWFIILEFTIVRFGIVFNLDYSFFGMAQVIWVIGVSMIAMSALIYLPWKVVAAAGIAIVFFHNLLDPISVPANIAFAGQPVPTWPQTLWIILHGVGIIPIFGGQAQIFFPYAVLPWLGVMMAGFGFGQIYTLASERRMKLLLSIGLAATALFIILRSINIYGDPSVWTTQASPLFTFLSFLNVTKYPPSLLFVLMTVGPGILLLALTDKIDGTAIWQKVCITFGRVPMFYYILQWFTAHGAGVLLSLLAGKETGYLFLDIFKMGEKAPPGHGFSLAFVYAAWIAGLILLYPICSWYAGVKQRNRHWALSYL